MEPNVLNERVHSLSQKVGMNSALIRSLFSVTTAIVIGLGVMIFMITTQLSSLRSEMTEFRYSIDAVLDDRFDVFETKFDTRLDALEAKFDAEIASKL